MSRPRPSTPQSAAALIVIVLLAVLAPQLFRTPAPNPPVTAPPPQITAPSSDIAPSATIPRPTIAFRSRAALEEHFHKHGHEFGPNTTIDQYLRAAQSLRDAPTTNDILELKRSDNVTTRFDKRTGAFLATNPDGTIRTFFRPTDGQAYFTRQAQRPED